MEDSLRKVIFLVIITAIGTVVLGDYFIKETPFRKGPRLVLWDYQDSALEQLAYDTGYGFNQKQVFKNPGCGYFQTKQYDRRIKKKWLGLKKGTRSTIVLTATKQKALKKRLPSAKVIYLIGEVSPTGRVGRVVATSCVFKTSSVPFNYIKGFKTTGYLAVIKNNKPQLLVRTGYNNFANNVEPKQVDNWTITSAYLLAFIITATIILFPVALRRSRPWQHKLPFYTTIFIGLIYLGFYICIAPGIVGWDFPYASVQTHFFGHWLSVYHSLFYLLVSHIGGVYTATLVQITLGLYLIYNVLRIVDRTGKLRVVLTLATIAFTLNPRFIAILLYEQRNTMGGAPVGQVQFQFQEHL